MVILGIGLFWGRNIFIFNSLYVLCIVNVELGGFVCF